MKISEFASRVTSKCGGRMTATGSDGKLVSIEPTLIITLITTILPAILGWVKQCRELKNNRDVQPSIQQHHANLRTSSKQHAALCQRIKRCCREGINAEKRRAKATGTPADLGRYQLDDASIDRLAEHSIAQMVTLSPDQCAALVSAAGA